MKVFVLFQELKMKDPPPLIQIAISYILTLRFMIGVYGGNDIWPLERPDGMPAIQSLEVMCGKDHMDVHLQFTQPFEGIVSSKGQFVDPRCVYVPPSTGKTFFSFRIAYSRCGTKPDLHGQFYENTIVVQYDKDLLEVWDEAKRLRCEWYNDYEKTASKPPMVIADLDVIQLDFRGDNVDCWMEIQHGKGPWAPPVSGIVPLGSTLTLVVAINDYRGEFDMRVKSCVASDGAGHIIHLSDEHGCVLRPKMISRFLKARINDERASVITYAFFHAFKFPDALSVHIKCKVEICRHGCLDHCQLGGGEGAPVSTGLGIDVHSDIPTGYATPLERKDSLAQKHNKIDTSTPSASPDGDLIYDDLMNLHEENEYLMGDAGLGGLRPKAQKQKSELPLRGDLPKPTQESQQGPAPTGATGNGHQEKFPHGPRNLNTESETILGSSNDTPAAPQRRRRSVVLSDRKARSTDVGVSGLYEVISEADLAFTPDNKLEAVTVFQGRIEEEVVYGICLPVQGFSALFVLVAVSAVVSALIAGALLYRYQVQRETQKIVAQRRHQTASSSQTNGHFGVNAFANWMTLRLMGSSHMTSSTSASNSNHER
ncbi:hypothetical protein M8J75_002963 [Diaphorina citri]|nr:hypothetical protein M8J75_002963 [Diaphorina citri]